MNNKLKYILVVFLALNCRAAYSQQPALSDADFNRMVLSLPNPFESKLPEPEPEPEPEEKIEEEPEESVNPEPDTETQKEAEEIPEPIVEEPAMPKFSIQGVIWNSDRPQAIINNTIIDVGDTILGVEILDIQKTNISGRFNGKIVNLNRKGVSHD